MTDCSNRLPESSAIVEALIEFRKHNDGRLPRTNSKGYEPEGFKWCTILNLLRDEKKITPVQLMAQHGHEHKGRQGRRRTDLPDNALILQAIEHYKTANGGRLPHQKAEGHEPENWPYSWRQLLERLRTERQLTPSALIQQNGGTHLPMNSYAQPLPDNEEIACAIRKYIKHNSGLLPDHLSKEHMPENWPCGWSHLILRLRKERQMTLSDVLRQSETQNMKSKRGRKTHPLPENSVIAKAMDEFRIANGHPPRSRSKGYEPEGWPFGWERLFVRLRQERSLNSKTLLEQEGYNKTPVVERLDRRFLRGEKFLAQDVFNGLVRFARANKSLPDPANKGHFVFGMSAPKLAEHFANKVVVNFQDIPALDDIAFEDLPKTLEDFMLASGLALKSIKPGHPLILNEDIPALIPCPSLSREAA